MKAKQAGRPTLKTLADKTGVSVVSLRAWKKEGVDVFDPDALGERVARMKGGPTGETMKAERLRKLRADASLAEHELAKRRGQVIDGAIVAELFQALTIAAIAQLKRLPCEVPGMLEGMAPPEMQRALADFRDEAILAVRSAMEGVFHRLETSPPKNPEA